MVVGQIRGGLAGTAFITAREAEQVAKLEQQRRDYAYTTITRSEMEKTIELNDEQIETYYQDNSSQYRTEEQVKVEYITSL